MTALYHSGVGGGSGGSAGKGAPPQGGEGDPAHDPPMVIRGSCTETAHTFYTVAVDWLRYTVPGLGFSPEVVPNHSLFAVVDGSPISPLRFYERVVRLACGGRVDYTQSRRDQGRLVTFDGAACREIWGAGYGDHILRYVADVGKPTRIDVALDVVGAGACPSDVVQAWHDGRLVTLAHDLSETRSLQRNGGRAGHTVYVGSRTSQMMARVYDKAVREGVDVPGGWLRVELECKGSLALFALSALLHNGVEVGGLALLRMFMTLQGVQWWDDVYAGRALPALVHVEQRLTDRQRWYRDTVIPALRSDLARDDGFLRFALLALVEDIEAHGSLRPVQSLSSARARAALRVLERYYGLDGGFFKLAFGIAGTDALYGLLEALRWHWDAKRQVYVSGDVEVAAKSGQSG